MKAYYSTKADFSFIYPEAWTVEEGQDFISVFDSKNGLGALQISLCTLEHHENLILEDELEEYTAKRHGRTRVITGNKLVFTNYLEGTDNRYWKYWLFLKSNTLAFISYNCNECDVGKEDLIISGILNSAGQKS